MRWTWLGHACWLLEAAGHRILFDPVLGETYHDGVFCFSPSRKMDIDGLKPDIIIVTHRHPDHFDLLSLAHLAEHYPSAIVITSEALISNACERLGFEVRTVGDWQRIRLTGLDLLTTPSRAHVKEWGVMVHTEGLVWNQVDTLLGGPQGVRQILSQAAQILSVPELETQGPSLTLAHWQPLKQIEVVRAGPLGFPERIWGHELAQMVALGGGALVPAAANQDYLGDGAWQRHHAFPASRAQLERDLRKLKAPLSVMPSLVGGVYQVKNGRVALEEQRSALLTVDFAPDGRVFAPFEIPPIIDTNREGHDSGLLRAALGAWVEQRLVPQLAQHLGPHGPLSCVLEWVFPDGREIWTLRVDEGRCALTCGDDPTGIFDCRLLHRHSRCCVAAVIGAGPAGGSCVRRLEPMMW